MYFNEINFSVVDKDTAKYIINIPNLFLWVINPDKELINNLPKHSQIYCNTVYLSKEKELINGELTSEYESYFENIRFKALNRLLFFNYRTITFLPLNIFNNITIPDLNGSDINLHHDNSFKVKNSVKIKKFFWDFEDYIVHQKNLPEGRNIFSKHDFFKDIKKLSQKKLFGQDGFEPINYDIKINET